MSILTSYSFSSVKFGFPTGWGIAIAPAILTAPTVLEIGVTVQT